MNWVPFKLVETDMPDCISCKFTVSGRVQGVGFRRFVQKLGLKYGLSGTVKNNFDGTVYVTAKGRSKDIDLFLSDVEKGSFFSRVDELLIDEKNSVETSNSYPVEGGFEIRY